MHPQEPCAVCAQADTCRLKLNCSRYLRYREAKEQAAEDRYNLQRCKGIVAMTEDHARSTLERWQKAAKENPWVPVQEQLTPDTETGNNLHEEDKTMPNMETLTPHIMLHNATLLRIQHLLELRKTEDSPAVRGLFVDLSVGLLRDGLMAEENIEAV